VAQAAAMVEPGALHSEVRLPLAARSRRQPPAIPHTCSFALSSPSLASGMQRCTLSALTDVAPLCAGCLGMLSVIHG
jgi:hypothetical protein